jgi:hypothetical protein
MRSEIVGTHDAHVSPDHHGPLYLVQDAHPLLQAVDLGYGVHPLRLDFVVAVLRESDLDDVSGDCQNEKSLLVCIYVDYVIAENLEGQSGELNGLHAFQQVVVPDVDDTPHGPDGDALKAFAESCDFILVVLKDADVLEELPDQDLSIFVASKDDVFLFSEVATLLSIVLILVVSNNG